MQDQHGAEPELPVGGAGAGQRVLRHQEHRRAEQRAVEAPGAAERQDDEQLGRALEAERVDADEARGLRKQTACDAGHRGRQREDRAQPAVNIRADGGHAPRVLADPAQRQTERRMNDPPRQHEHQRQDREAVETRRGAVETERELAEQRGGLHVAEPIDAAGDRRRLIRHLGGQEADAQRHHQARQIRAGHDAGS